MNKKIYNAIIEMFNDNFPNENTNDFHIQFQGDEGIAVAILVINYNKPYLKKGCDIKIKEVWLDEDRLLYAVSNNSISIIMNNIIKNQIDDFYCKMKDVLNAEYKNFEIRFSRFIETVGEMM